MKEEKQQRGERREGNRHKISLAFRVSRVREREREREREEAARRTATATDPLSQANMFRMCMPTMHPIAYTSHGHVEGYFADEFESYINQFRLMFTNATVVQSDKIGDLIDPHERTFDGCLGQLQANQSDIELMFVHFPILAPNLSHSIPLHSSKIVIASVYSKNVSDSRTNVMQAFFAFDWQLWLLLIAFSALLCACLTLLLLVDVLQWLQRAKPTAAVLRPSLLSILHRSVKRSVKVWTGNAVRQYASFTMPQRIHVSSGHLLHVSFLLFSFYVLFFFSAMIKTDMVVPKMPDLISSYDDILSRDEVKPMFAKQLSDKLEFQEALLESKEHLIWKKVLKIEREFGEDSCLFTIGPGLLDVTEEIIAHRAVMLVPSYPMPPSVANMCAMMQRANRPDVVSWINDGNAEREHLTGLMHSSFLRTSWQRILRRFFQLAFQADLISQLIKATGYMVFKDTGSQSQRECESGRLIQTHADLQRVPIRHYAILFWLLLLMFAAVTLLIFAFECFIASAGPRGCRRRRHHRMARRRIVFTD